MANEDDYKNCLDCLQRAALRNLEVDKELAFWIGKATENEMKVTALQRAIETLKGLARFYQKSRDLNLDVTPTEGKVFPFTVDTSLKRRWYTVRTELGLPNLRLHDLRVTFARSLADKGHSLRTIQALLSHSTITMTARYIPPDLERMREAVASLDESQRTVVGRSTRPSRHRTGRGR